MSDRRHRLLRATAPLACMIVAGTASGAFAQSAASPSDRASSVSEVVVTGSRIRRPDLTSDQPVAVVSGELQNVRGYTTVAESLNNLPIAGVPESPRGAQGDNVGRNYVNLFNLGSQRTLTLINGRRFVTSNAPTGASVNPGTQVDLNNIPSGLIDRVEIVQATGAATYGSDAIAGVVNILLKKEITGLQVDGQYAVSERGDVPRKRVSVTGGFKFAEDRGSFVGAYEHSSSGGLLNSDRDWGLGYSFFPNPADTSRTDGIPANILVCCRTQTDITLGGLPLVRSATGLGAILNIPDPAHPGSTVPAQFAPDGTLVPYNPGTIFRSGTANGQGWNTAYFMNLLAPIKRDVFYTTASYQLSPQVKLFAEASASSVRAEESARQAGLLNSPQNSSTGPQGAVRLSIDNPFLTTQARNLIAAQGLSTFFLTRYNADLVPGNGRVSKTDTQRGVLGLEGDLKAFDHNFYWNAYGNWGVSRGHLNFYDIHAQRFANAVDAVRAPNGQIVCRVTLQNPGSLDPNISRCQPLNLFGQGAPSAAAAKFVDVLLQQESELRETNYQANLGGDLLDLPAGKLRFSVGLDYRKETFNVSGNQARINGEGRLGSLQPFAGGYSTREAYGEVLAPLFGGDFTLPMVHSLELQGAYRYSDNSIVGADKAWNAGLKWKPVEDVTIRGSISRTFRTPSAVEFFLPRQPVSTSSISDPCDFRFIASGANPATRTANCQALFRSLGLPANYQLSSNVVNIGFPFPLGGNPNLKNEIAESWTAGLVWQPKFIPGLSLTADYVSIDLKDAIFVFNGASITRVCYDAPSPDPAICGLLTRDSQAQITNIEQGYVNAGFIKYRGWEFNATYGFDLETLHEGLPGRLNLTANARNTLKYDTSVTGFTYDVDPSAGEFTAPHWTGQFTATYLQGPVTLSWNTQYVGPAVSDLTFTNEDRDVLGTDAIWRHDVSAQYTINDRIRLRAGVYNLFDTEPQHGTVAIGLSNTNGGYLDVIGRSYFVGATVQF